MRRLVNDYVERHPRLDAKTRELTTLGDRLVEKVASLECLARDRLDIDQQAEMLDREHRHRQEAVFVQVVDMVEDRKWMERRLLELERLARAEKPKLIIAGGSAYSRIIDFKAFRTIADAVGAFNA